MDIIGFFQWFVLFYCVVKSSLCYWRNILKDDPQWIAAFGGLMAGLSIFIEHPSRRTELALYVIPRALEVVLRMVDWRIFRSRLTSVLTFQLTIAAWMHLRNQDDPHSFINNLNYTVLRVIFGTPKEI